jgi:hypothetical protein
MEQADSAAANQFGVACKQCRRFIFLPVRPTASEFSAACNRCGTRDWYPASAVVMLGGSAKPKLKSAAG